MARGLRASTLSKMVKPGQYVCFCGCVDGKHGKLTNIPARNFQGHLGLDSGSLVPQEFKAGDQVALWMDIKHSQDNALVLKSNDEIEQYVLSVVKNYFRTTMKASVTLDSNFSDHGLDSLDAIELVI